MLSWPFLSSFKALTKIADVTNFVKLGWHSIAMPEDANSTFCPTRSPWDKAIETTLLDNFDATSSLSSLQIS